MSRRSRSVAIVLLLAGCRPESPEHVSVTAGGVVDFGDEAESESESESDGSADSESGAAEGGAEGPDPVVGCGNGVAEDTEECDGDDHRGEVCSSLGFEGSGLGCNDDCTFDLGTCETCGSGTLEPHEECDGDDTGQFLFQSDASCVSRGYSGGVLLCVGCRVDTSQCSVCGNGTTEEGELCDGEVLDDGTGCLEQGFMGGIIACAPDCQSLDTSRCF